MAKRPSRGSPDPKGFFLLGGVTPPDDAGVLPVGVTAHAGEVFPGDALPRVGGPLPVAPVGGVPPVGGQSVIELVEF